MNMKPVERFLKSGFRNGWILVGGMNMYVRKGMHAVDGEIRCCFDVASVQQVRMKNAGKGQFTRFLAEAETLAGEAGFQAVLVESVQNERLAAFLPRQGYTYLPRSFPPSFYKLLAEKQADNDEKQAEPLAIDCKPCYSTCSK